MRPPTEPDRQRIDRPDRPLRLTTPLRPARPGWRRRALGLLPALAVTLAMFAAALGAGRLGGRLLRPLRDAVLDEQVRFAAPPVPRPVASVLPRPARPAPPRTPPPRTGAPAAPPSTTPAEPVTTPESAPIAAPAASPDTGAPADPGRRLRAAERAARAALGAESPPPLIGAPRPSVPGRAGASLVGVPSTNPFREPPAASPMRPIAPDYTDRARALAGTSPAELAPGQRRDLARALIAADLERTQWLPCAYSPGAQAPGGRSANTMRLGCQPAATLFPAEPTAESPRVTLAPLGATIKLSRDGESAVTITPFGIAGHIPIPGLGGPSRATRARNAAVDAENRRILARIRDRTRRRTDSLSWIAESTRAARDSVARATAKPPG